MKTIQIPLGVVLVSREERDALRSRLARAHMSMGQEARPHWRKPGRGPLIPWNPLRGVVRYSGEPEQRPNITPLTWAPRKVKP